MSLSIGIVGLPNVGKSTLFNAITNATVDAQNYPFCTIEPNSGIVAVPDDRIDKLSEISKTQKKIYSTIEFVDIAGLVKGASKGEGLGNKFLANIRETSAIAHVTRCFEDTNIVHVEGKIDPINDIETINIELTLSDFEIVQKLLDSQRKKIKSNDKEEVKKFNLYEKLIKQLEINKPIRQLDLSTDEKNILKGCHLLTAKRVIYIANISENDIGSTNKHVEAVQKYAKDHGDACIVLCSKLESELAELGTEEKKEYLQELNIEESGLDQLSKACYSLLNLQSYLTTGEKETRAWTINVGDTAPQAAGVIHTDFEKGFIRANILNFDTFVQCGGWKIAKEKGLVRQEGKEYIMKDGDVVEFLFNV